MKINEVRSQIKNYTKEEMQTLVTEMYKAIPKKVKEEKEIAKLIKDPQYFKGKRKKSNDVVEVSNIESLVQEVHIFIEHANLQYYIAPNRIVPKKDRAKWRFKVKKFYRDLLSAFQVPEYRESIVECMENLYKLLCYASGYYVFTSSEPFNTINISQDEFLKQILVMKKEIADPRSWVTDCIHLVLDNRDDHSYDRLGLHDTFVDLLHTAPLVEIAIVEAKQLQSSLEKQRPNQKKTNFDYELDQLELNINNIVEFVFLCHVKLHEWDEGISYWNRYYKEYDAEISVFRLLYLLETFNRLDEWKQEYKRAVQSGIKVRDRLIIQHNFIKEYGRFPTTDDIIDIYNARLRD